MVTKQVGADNITGVFVGPATFKRYEPVWHVKGDGTTDSFSAIQAAIVSAEVAGGRVVLTGLHPLNSGGGLKLTRNNAGTRGWVTIEFAPGASLKLSSSCPRAFEFQRVADFDTFQKIRITGAVIDANNINGSNDAVIGSWVNSVHAQRVNFQDIEIIDPHIFNLPAMQPSSHRPHIWLDSNEPGPPWPGSTQCTMLRIKIIRPRLYGGDAGVMLNCTPAGTSTPTGTNNFSDDILVEDAIIELNNGVAPTSFKAQSGIIIGGAGTGGKARIIRPVVKWSGDVGIEIDGFQDCVIDTPDTTNCKIGVYLNNFHPASDVDRQVTKIINPRHTVTSAWTGQYSKGIKNGTSNPYGKILIRDQEYYADGALYSTFATEFIGLATHVTGDVLETDIDGFQGRVTNFNFDGGSISAISVIDVATTHTHGKMKAKNLDCYLQYIRSGAAVCNGRVYAFHGTQAIAQVGPGVSWEMSSPSGDNFSTNAVAFGESISGITTSQLRGYVIGASPRPMTGDTNPRAIRFFAGSGAGTIIDGSFAILFCDFSKISGGAADNDIVWADSATKAKLKLAGNVYRGTTNLPTEAAASWDPASVASGASTSTTITLAGAAIGDMILPTLSLAIPAGMLLTANVTAADTVTVTLSNLSGGAVDLGNSTLRVRRLASLV